MAFMCSIACAFALLTLSAGIALLIWGFRNEGAGVVLAKVFGFIVTILSALMFLSSSYIGMSHLAKGHMMGMNKMYNKCNCPCNHGKQFCDKHMKNKLEDQVNQ